MEVSVSVRALYAETRAFLEGRQVSTGGKQLGVLACPRHALPSFGGKGSPPQQPFPQQLDSPQQEEALRQALGTVSRELQKFSNLHWMAPIANSVEEVGTHGQVGVAGAC